MTRSWHRWSLAAIVLGVALPLTLAVSPDARIAASAHRQVDAAQQIDEGWVVYESYCAQCHGTLGEGGEAPAVVGPRALVSFRTGRRLYDYVRLSMPADAPGALSQQEYYDVIAFLLDWNGLNPDRAVIDAETIEVVAFQ